MSDHHETAKQAWKENRWNYVKRSSYKTTHRLKDVNGLVGLDYDLFILDRDCTLQDYHGKKRNPEFEETLKLIGPKAELVSNSSYEELLKIRDLYGDLMTISKLVKFTEHQDPYLLRFIDGKLNILSMSWLGGYSDVTPLFSQGDTLFLDPSYNFKKPNPEIINEVVAANIFEKRIPENPKVLMVGDRYFTDIVCGNLANAIAGDSAIVDTARVNPYKPLSDKKPYLLIGRVFDSTIGNIMSRL